MKHLLINYNKSYRIIELVQRSPYFTIIPEYLLSTRIFWAERDSNPHERKPNGF